MGLPGAVRNFLQLNFKFRWMTTALNYLGTHISANLADTFAVNFPPLLSSVRALLDIWNRGIHLWFGQCNIIKMNEYSAQISLSISGITY